MLINKDNVHSTNYIVEYQSFLAPSKAAELNNIGNMLEGLNVTSQKEATGEVSHNPNEVPRAQPNLDS